VAGPRVYDTDSARFIEIKMNGLDLMKMKRYTRSNPGCRLTDGRSRATLMLGAAQISRRGGAMVGLVGVSRAVAIGFISR
jgi:hypothetical protein